MVDRVLSFLVALSLAFLVWLYARSREQEILDNVSLPVDVSLTASQADQYSLEVTGTSQVAVSFSGPPARVRELRGMLQRGEMRVAMRVTVPDDRLQDSSYLDTVRVEPGDVHPPPGVTAMVMEGRNRIPVTLHRLVEQRLPVRFDFAQDDRVGQVVVEPATVLVRGPKEVLDRVRSVPTQHYCVPSRPDAAHTPQTLVLGPVPLASDLEKKPIQTTPCAVSVRVTLTPRRKTFDLEVPVQFLTPSQFPWRPHFNGDGRDGKVTLKVEGPAVEEAPSVVAFIDLTGRKFDHGNHVEPVRIQCPKEFQVVQPPTRLVPFRLDPPDLTTSKEIGVD
jgi:hypothetical protein